MILEKYAEINIAPAHLLYWQNKGYNVVVNTKHSVLISDLAKNSNTYIHCVCDICQIKYEQRFSRNTDICGKCRLKKFKMGNQYGCKNIKYTVVEKVELLELIKLGHGKQHIAKKYGVSITVVDRWFKKHNISLDQYYGRKYYKTPVEKLKDIVKIKEKIDKDISISEISKKTNIPRHIIGYLRKEGKINIKSMFDYWKDDYVDIENKINFYISENNTKSLSEISNIHNISIEQLRKVFRVHNIPIKLHSYNKSKGELECKEFISSLNEKCFSTLLDKKYEIDCFVIEKNFGVEYCGEYWHRYVPSKKNKNYHLNKFKFCQYKGIKLMTVFESEWKNKKNIIKSMILSRLGRSNKIHARKCRVCEVGNHQAKQFHEKNHVSGSINSSINIGLFSDDVLISVLSFVKSRYDKKYEYEISRYSTMLEHTVVGGLGKMFNYFIKKYDPTSCMTYSDLRFGLGKCYEKIGFNFIKQTVPNYYYLKKNNDELESRFKYQKQKLIGMPGYSIKKTEYEIMDENGFFRVYDCGNYKYSWIKK